MIKIQFLFLLKVVYSLAKVIFFSLKFVTVILGVTILEDAMTKKQTYLFLLAMGLLIIMVGHFMHIGYVNRFVHSTWTWMQNPLIFGPAAICAFVFMSNKRYWMINLGAALVVSLIVQFFVVKGSVSLDIILIRVFAFLVVVYLLNLIKVILDK